MKYRDNISKYQTNENPSKSKGICFLKVYKIWWEQLMEPNTTGVGG